MPAFKMSVDLNVLDHLATGLYTSVAAILTEAVANAWDADATEVRITMDIGGDRIVIQDNGGGMDQDAMNSRYLRVGYRRRDEQPTTTTRGRAVMGRKGIGKLSLMSIADRIEVVTKEKAGKAIGAAIVVDELRKSMRSGQQEYYPDELSSPRFAGEHGTILTLSSLNQKRLKETRAESARRRLARRFSVIGSADFRVSVNGTDVTSADREDLKFVEYLWEFRPPKVDTSVCSLLTNEETLEPRHEAWDKSWILKGWIGTTDKPKRLKTSEGNLNSVVLMARGRLVEEDILPRVGNAEIFMNYLTGMIEADFLDLTDEDDIITSSRQSLIEDDERVGHVVAHVREAVRTIGNRWNQLRQKDGTSELLKQYPNLDGWLKDLPSSWQPKAKKLLGQVATVALPDASDSTHREVLLRHSVLGFERLRLKNEDAGIVSDALEYGVAGLLKLLQQRDKLEASFYADIVSNRLETIRKLKGLVDSNELEKVIQQYLFEHLWLLDPSWERATGSAHIEKQLAMIPEFVDSPATKQEFGRIDIRYRTVAGKHVIVELKRPSVNPGLYALLEQGAKYAAALEGILTERPPHMIEVVFVVGKAPHRDKRQENLLIAANARLLTYKQLITRASAAYEEFFRAHDNADELNKLFETAEPTE